jgi:hypothetical protein
MIGYPLREERGGNKIFLGDYGLAKLIQQKKVFSKKKTTRDIKRAPTAKSSKSNASPVNRL